MPLGATLGGALPPQIEFTTLIFIYIRQSDLPSSANQSLSFLSGEQSRTNESSSMAIILLAWPLIINVDFKHSHHQGIPALGLLASSLVHNIPYHYRLIHTNA